MAGNRHRGRRGQRRRRRQHGGGEKSHAASVPYIVFGRSCAISTGVGGRARQAILGAALAALVAVAAHAAAAATPLWIVFTASPDGTRPTQLYRVQTTGTGLEQITKGSGPATDAAFSPDGKRVVFARLGTGIFVTNLDGTGLRRLTTGTRDTYPVWSPNGKRIAFVRIFKTEWRLYVMTAAGAGREAAAEVAAVRRGPRGRPTASRSSFPPVRASRRSMRAPARAETLQRHARPVDLAGRDGGAEQQGVRLRRSARNPTGPPDCGESHCPAFALYLFDATKGKTRKLVNDTGPAGWSPDCEELVYVAHGDLTLSAPRPGSRPRSTPARTLPSGDAPPAWQPR